jgi:hypothetical protein
MELWFQKLVGLTPNDIEALACSSDLKTCTSAADGLSVASNASDSVLGRDTAKKSIYVSLNHTAVMEGVSAKVNTMAEVENYKASSKTEVSKINVEENEETEIEAECSKSTVQMESNHVAEVKNDKTMPKTRNDKDSSKVKNDKFSQVNSSTILFSSQSEYLTTFLKTNPPTAPLSENSTDITAKDCATILGHSVTPERQAVVTDSDISLHTVQLEPGHKQADNIIQGDAVQVAGLCDTTLSNMLPAVSDFGASASQGVCTAKLVTMGFEEGLTSVKVKQEKPSGYGDTDLSVFDSSVDRLQEPEEVKLEHEVMP